MADAVIAPYSFGRPLAGRFFALIVAEGHLTLAVGLLAAKFAAFNCLPLPGLSGGQALLELLQCRRPWPPHAVANTHLVGMLGLLVIQLLLLGAWVGALFSR